MTQANWIAVDWGTTHLRAWVIGTSGEVLAHLKSDDGMGTLSPEQFEPALLALLADYLPDKRAIPVICCGMVGARQGWVEAPYSSAPCAPPGPALATAPPTKGTQLNVKILPGVQQTRPADVMRGEETQIAGFLSHQPGFDGVICLPGTHTKWVQISAKEIISFATYMTGELFALLSTASVLRHSLTTDWDNDAFQVAIADTMSRPQAFAGRLFTLRADSLLNDQPGGVAHARLSGLLIGLELAAARPYWLGQNVALVGSDRLMQLYDDALSAQGVNPVRYDADQMTLAGLTAAYDTLKGTQA